MQRRARRPERHIASSRVDLSQLDRVLKQYPDRPPAITAHEFGVPIEFVNNRLGRPSQPWQLSHFS